MEDIMANLDEVVLNLVKDAYPVNFGYVSVPVKDLKELTEKVLGNCPELQRLKRIEKAQEKKREKFEKEAKSWDDWRGSLVK